VIRFVLTGNPGHLKAFDYTGPYRYFLTFCADSRQRMSVTRERVDLVLLQIERSAAEEQFEIIAYCFMPDHIHLLIQGLAESSDCRRFIGRVKQFSGYQCIRRTTSVVKLIPSSADSCAGVIRMSTPGDRRSHMLELA
jgi:REP element-mobilizing transposase RayT